MSWDQNEAEKEKKLVGQFGIHWVSITFTQTEKKPTDDNEKTHIGYSKTFNCSVIFHFQQTTCMLITFEVVGGGLTVNL